MNIQKELTTFFESSAGETLIGNIVLKAVNQALTIEVRYEDGKSEPGRVVEKTETGHLRDWLAKYMPHVEAGLRGCQADAAKARNRATQTRDVVIGLVDTLGRIAAGADPLAAARELGQKHATLLIDYQKEKTE